MVSVVNGKYMSRVEEPFEIANLTNNKRFDLLYVRELEFAAADAYVAGEGVDLPANWNGDMTVSYLILYGNNNTGYTLDIDYATGKIRFFNGDAVEHAAGTLGAKLAGKKVTLFILGIKDAAQIE